MKRAEVILTTRTAALLPRAEGESVKRAEVILSTIIIELHLIG